jgi:starch synthase
MRVLHAASELYPLVSTGGLSSVVGALPEALNRVEDVQCSVIIPFYRDISPGSSGVEWLAPQKTFAGEVFGLARTVVSGVDVFLVAKDEYFDRNGIYGPTPETSWHDNAARFSFFSRAVASLSAVNGFAPDIIHCHDWQAALIPVYLREVDTATVLTIHNIQFQGRFPKSDFKETLLPETLYNVDGIEFWGDWNSLKGGITFADQLTTVSPSYAREITTPEFGCDLDGLLREHVQKLTGILNGIDSELWDPATDKHIYENYTLGRMAGKKSCRRALCSELGIKPSGNAPLLGMVSRLTFQKGIDLIVSGMDALMEMDFSLAVLGTGESWAESALAEEAAKYPDRVSVTVSYDDSLARRVFAGAEAYLMPSAFEPCGLGQMMAMRYGTVPLVRSVGGLSDTVTDDVGFSFVGNSDEFAAAMERLLDTWRTSRKWGWMRRRCMSRNFSWNSRVVGYLEVYRKALKGTAQ